MKKIIIAIAFIALGFTASAQQKIGYINSMDLLQAMPEIAKADKDVEAFAKSFQTQLESYAKEYEQKVKAYQATVKTLNESIREIKEREITDLQSRIQKLQQDGEKKVTDKREELYKPILDKADKAIKDVGKEKGYTYILDASSGSMLYATETEDIMKFVKVKLGIK